MDEFDYEFDNNSQENGNWQDEVECPFCGSTSTIFVEMNYEMSVYECQACDRRFEIEK